MDVNNNSSTTQDRYVTNFDVLTKDNVEAQLEKLKIIDDDYQSDEDNRVGPFDLAQVIDFDMCI